MRSVKKFHYCRDRIKLNYFIESFLNHILIFSSLQMIFKKISNLHEIIKTDKVEDYFQKKENRYQKMMIYFHH